MNLEFNKNEDIMKRALSEMHQRFAHVALGGGKKAIAKQKEKNKLTARERISYLLDADTPFIEIGAFAGWEMHEEQGGCPSAGTVAGEAKRHPGPTRCPEIRSARARCTVAIGSSRQPNGCT